MSNIISNLMWIQKVLSNYFKQDMVMFLCFGSSRFLFGYVESLVYANQLATLDAMPPLLEEVTQNWTIDLSNENRFFIISNL